MDTPQDPPRRDDPSGGPVESAVDAALDRVHALLRQARVTAAPDAPSALDARGWWELSLEAALRDEPRESARLADSGLAALVPGQDDVRLALLRALAVAAGQVGDEAALTRWVEARAALLRHLGRPRQAGLESQLGAALVRDPDTVEAAVLAGVVEDEPGAPGEDPGDTVLPEAALALIILLDQLPRNAFRDTAHMFATDPLALGFAKEAIRQGHDSKLPLELRAFMLMPMMHAESLEDQERLLTLLDEEREPETYKFAVIHRDIIARFGRFPHRNACLYRSTTPQEDEFLVSGGFSG
mgnify:CR=1 FL=1